MLSLSGGKNSINSDIDSVFTVIRRELLSFSTSFLFSSSRLLFLEETLEQKMKICDVVGCFFASELFLPSDNPSEKEFIHL